MSIFDTTIDASAGPQLVVDLDVMRRNVEELERASAGVPLRLATKSVRVRSIIDWALARPSFVGVLAYSAAEALWLARSGVTGILIGYPSVDVQTMRAVAAEPALAQQITFMIDLPEHVALLADAAVETGAELRACLDVDASLRVGRMNLGTHRSSVHSPDEAAGIARFVAQTAGVRLVGLMMYEAQVAGMGDLTSVHRLIKRRSLADLAERRSAVRAAVEAHADLEFFNGGGTGSAHLTSVDHAVSDIAVGSGLFTSTHFDTYDDLTTAPAAYFVSPVVRKPAPGVAVTYSGGYHASGPAGSSRLPTPVWPEGLRYFGQEGPGEVQTPLHGRGARDLRVGDLVWFRHTKAGEACERFDRVHLVDGGRVTQTVPTYRGEGKNYG